MRGPGMVNWSDLVRRGWNSAGLSQQAGRRHARRRPPVSMHPVVGPHGATALADTAGAGTQTVHSLMAKAPSQMNQTSRHSSRILNTLKLKSLDIAAA